MDQVERIESHINEWFDEDTWIGSEGENNSDEVLEKEAMERIRFGENMSYLTSKHQPKESRTKMEVLQKEAMERKLRKDI
nr:hypothetical protein [Tanacetum cinerariifolium]